MIVHPQFWPEDLDYQGKQVVVIGSGATAVTLIPAMADDTAHITMLQRSPSHVMPLPGRTRSPTACGKVLPDTVAYRVTRSINKGRQRPIYGASQRYPKQVRRIIRALNVRRYRGL